MPDYLVLKHAHAGMAYLTVFSFIARGSLMWAKPEWLGKKLVRILPHVIDTVLLLLGLTLMVHGGLYPGQQPWLAAKLLALLVYIGLGVLALRGPTPALRAAGFAGALLTVGYILGVAKTKLVWPF
jgi:uncharacterized membrane protein SirB2